ncbi:MAG: O-antigen ligase family protein [Verrucomicrobia bacterium]|nr:O-antigen ligase family protein [Verrucomicrobiota bacterium]
MVNPSASSRVIQREKLVVAHVALVALVSAWLLGGIGPRLEWVIAALAAPAYYFLFAEARYRLRHHDRAGLRRLLRWTAPLLALAVFIIISALNPSHRPAFLFNTYVLRPVAHVEWLPASALPLASLRVLACFGGLAATGLTLAFCIYSRRLLRSLILLLAFNALVLAVLGTLQHQALAPGPYFGFVTSHNPAWFATFLYHNHWGAFAVLSTASTLGLVFHSLRYPPDNGWFHGPGPLLTLTSILVAATAPLSSSRSATVLMALLAISAGAASLRHHFRTRHRNRHQPLRASLIVGLLALFVTLGGLVFFQSREVIQLRFTQTLEQIAHLRSGPDGYTRADLYADTWRMAADRPAFGWGLDSYGPIFLNYSRFRPGPDRLMNTFEDAHSDWLQSLAELGFVGTGLLLLCVLLPLAETVRLRRLTALPGGLFTGCALIALYAWVEFPFANPAVVALWWILFFSGIRILQLSPAVSARSRAACSPSSS